jgi:PAS domain S-box-containing protein
MGWQTRHSTDFHRYFRSPAGAKCPRSKRAAFPGSDRKQPIRYPDQQCLRPPLTDIAPYEHSRIFSYRRITAPGNGLPSHYELDLLHKDGTIILEWDGQPAVQRTFINISERKKAEAELAESEHRYRELFEDLKLGLMISGRDGLLLVNNAYAELLGYESADAVMAIDRFGDIAPHDRHRALTLGRIEAEAEQLPSPIEFDLLHRDGSFVPVEVYWRLFDWEGKKAVQRIFVDLTERKLAQAALIESEREYRDLIERAPIGMQIASGSGRRLWVNAAFATMLGYDNAEQMLDLPGYSLVAPYHHDRLYPFSEIAKQGTVSRESDEIDLVCKDGSYQRSLSLIRFYGFPRDARCDSWKVG